MLIDFGAAKQYEEESGENTSTLVGRTPGYAPPEQMSDSVKQFYPATDIYAVGATLYKLLTGVTPPSATDLASGDAELPPLPAGVSGATAAAVHAAMRLKRADRPQSTAEFLALLESRVPDDATVIDTAPPVPKPKPKPKPEPALVPEPKVKWKAKYTYALLAVILVAAVVLAVVDSAGSIAGHEYVDLGLSVKWATCNVGAISPEDYGDYYAWGETAIKTVFDEDNCATYEEEIGDIAGTSRDVARVKWGGSWRMPTLAECEELVDKCAWTWTTQGGHEGYKVTGPNGKSIFLPAAGNRYGTSLYYAGEWGGYWSSSPYEGYAKNAYYLSFVSGGHLTHWDGRYYGRTVRPVTKVFIARGTGEGGSGDGGAVVDSAVVEKPVLNATEVRKLYNHLSMYYNMPGYKEFEVSIGTDEGIKKAYNRLGERTYVGNFGAFKSSLYEDDEPAAAVEEGKGAPTTYEAMATYKGASKAETEPEVETEKAPAKNGTWHTPKFAATASETPTETAHPSARKRGSKK